MLDSKGEVLYVGKAKNLKKRVNSYFQRQLDAKTLQLVAQIKSIEVTITRNEREALLLESSIIKSEMPRYNIIFRDDKSYPYLKLTIQEPFPQLSLYRGSKSSSTKYYGPYPSAREAREALYLLQNIFTLRQCDETFFKNRARPCLQYQIKRCSAPCVGYISKEDYARDVNNAKLFLEGKNKAVVEQLIHKMEDLSQKLLFEKAAQVRNQISLLRSIQERQIIIGASKDIDVLGIAILNQEVCIHRLIIREGRILGSRQYFPNKTAILTDVSDNISDNVAEGSKEQPELTENILKTFILQHYADPSQGNGFPSILLLPFALKEEKTLLAILQEKSPRISIMKAARGDRLKWIKMAMMSAKQALQSQARYKIDLSPRFLALQDTLQLEAIPERIECFDVSHSLGEATVMSCVVLDTHGSVKEDYRRYNIKVKAGGNDILALTEGLTRHYTRLKSEGRAVPDIVLVDGGKGQLNCARSVLEELQVVGVTLLSVAKGPKRKAGLETVYMATNGSIKTKVLALKPAALHLIQQCRDEAHRFAIQAQRKQRINRRMTSSLEAIEGIGKVRRQKLLQYFGGLQEVKAASVEELAKVPGVSLALAERLYTELHGKE